MYAWPFYNLQLAFIEEKKYHILQAILALSLYIYNG
jgi:hypothetical protein